MKRNFRGEFNSKTTSITRAGNHLIIGGLDVVSFAAAAVQMSGFAPTFNNTSLMPQIGGMKTETSQFSSNKMSSGSGVTAKTAPHVDMHQFIDFSQDDVHNILQCNSSSSSSKNRIKEQQNRNLENSVLPNTIPENSHNSSDNILEQYKRLLYLETSQGVLVYFPDLKRKEMHIDQQGDRNRVETNSDKNNKNSWQTIGNDNRNQNENMKEKKGREKRDKGSVEYSDNSNDNNHDKEHPDDDCNDDVGNWRDNDSEEEEEREESDNDDDDDDSEEEDSDEEEDEEDMDTPNFRNSISPKTKKDDYGFADKNIALNRTKKSSSGRQRQGQEQGQEQGQSVVGPVPGSIWKLLAPSSDDVSVGEM